MNNTYDQLIELGKDAMKLATKDKADQPLIDRLKVAARAVQNDDTAKSWQVRRATCVLMMMTDREPFASVKETIKSRASMPYFLLTLSRKDRD